MLQTNITTLTGFIKKIYPKFITPSGVSITRFVLVHESMQKENNISRQVSFEMFCIKIGEFIDEIIVGSYVEICGFIHVNRQKQLILHTDKITKLN
ncbi:MAG: hypothetical protein PHC75_03790 [Burkholderiales bacterium]|nr:hypothetical protein [Burkholderiales bacterium]